MVFEVLKLHEITEILPFIDFYDLYPGYNDPTDGTKIVLVGTPYINQLVWVDAAKED